MSLRIKAEHLGKRIAKSNEVIELTVDLDQNKLLYIKNMISSDFIEEFDESMELANKQVKDYISANKRKKKDVDNS